MDAAFAPWLADPELALAAPFLAAAVGGLTGRRVRAAFATALGLIIAAVLAASIAARLMGGGRILGAMGPAGEWRYELDAFSACALAGVFALGAALAAAAAASNDSDPRAGPAAPVAAAIAVALAGVALCSADMTFAALAVWGSTLAAIAATAIAAGRDQRGLYAAFEALAATTLAGSVAAIGAALAASAVGAPFDMLRDAGAVASPRALTAGVALALAGLAGLAALAPLQTWFAPLASRGIGLPVLAPAFAALAVALRLAGAAMQTGDAQLPWMACVALTAFGAASVAIGSLQALAAREGGRLVAYVATAHLGLVALGLGLGTPEGATAAMLQAAFAALALGALAAAWPMFGAGGAIDGLGARAPLSGAAATAALLSLMGAPLTAGFAGKWLLAAAALERGWYWIAWLLAAAALAAVVYTARALERIWFRASPASVGAAPAGPALLPAAICAWLAGAACIALGFDARGPEAVAHVAAAALMGGLR
ncbi:MAG: proton-conducting transporter membrane subunit [Caulobacterales bacterium]